MSDSIDEERCPAIPAVRLWERQGRAGPYLSGVWGGVRILIVRNADQVDANDAGWKLLLAPNDHAAARKPPRRVT